MQRALTTMIVIAVFAMTANAQVFISRSDSSMDKIVGQPFTLGEVGAVIIDNGKEIKVMHAMPVDMRPKAYKEIDIKDGDIILMCNGKRLKTLKDLEEAYNATAVAADFKLGVKRGEERMIVAFAKADPKDLPKMQMQMSTTDGPMPGGGNVRRMVFGGGGQDVTPLMGLGIIVGKKDDVFKIVGVMQNTAKGADFKVDDIVESLNGEKIKSTQQLSELYEKLAVGAKLELKYKREGKSLQASLTKPEAPQGRVMMRSNQ
jgi:PDZ domain-containing secreted protein